MPIGAHGALPKDHQIAMSVTTPIRYGVSTDSACYWDWREPTRNNGKHPTVARLAITALGPVGALLQDDLASFAREGG